MDSEGSRGKPLVVLATLLFVAGTVPWWGPRLMPLSPPYMDKMMYGVYLQGNDIESKLAEDANSEEQCSRACLQDSCCRAMSFVESEWGGGVCRLKDKVSTRSSGWNAISAEKAFPWGSAPADAKPIPSSDPQH
jgi:PAN domain